MKTQSKITMCLVASILIFASCEQRNSKVFDPNSLLPTIEANGEKWVQGIAKQDLDLIMQNYDDNAHYLPDSDDAIHGKENIRKYWKEGMSVLRDLELNTTSLEGQRELLYEIGFGSVKLYYDERVTDTLRFKYTNVWKLQDDGSYKAVFDMFNAAK